MVHSTYCNISKYIESNSEIVLIDLFVLDSNQLINLDIVFNLYLGYSVDVAIKIVFGSVVVKLPNESDFDKFSIILYFLKKSMAKNTLFAIRFCHTFF